MLSSTDKHFTSKSEQIDSVMPSVLLVHYINLYHRLFHTTCDTANIETTLAKLSKKVNTVLYLAL